LLGCFCPRVELALTANDHDWDIVGRHISDYARFRPSIKPTNGSLKDESRGLAPGCDGRVLT
jgi:hypothetical protein